MLGSSSTTKQSGVRAVALAASPAWGKVPVVTAAGGAVWSTASFMSAARCSGCAALHPVKKPYPKRLNMGFSVPGTCSRGELLTLAVDATRLIFRFTPRRQPRIDVAGIGAVRQRHKPARNAVGVLPLRMDEGLALAKGRIEVRIAERPAALERGQGHVALDGGELKRECRHRPGEAGQGLRLEPFHIDLDEGRHAMAGDQ